MDKNQLELLVLYQDISLMIEDAEAVEKTVGFQVEGIANLQKTLQDLEEKLELRYVRTYKRLKGRYKRPIAPVQNNTCLGCFAKLPTSYREKGHADQAMLTCEYCGRLLYWID